VTRVHAACAAALAACVALSAACDRGTQAANLSEPAAGNRSPSHEIVLDSKMLKSITVVAIAEAEAADPLVIAGKVQFDEDRVTRVLAPLAGQVVDLRVRVGDPVRRGDALFAISSREAGAAIGEQIESRKDFELAEKNAAMLRDLFEHEAASKLALQQAESDLAKARARVARTEEASKVLGLAVHDDSARLNGRVPIASPLSGVVIDRKVTEGQFVQGDGTPVVTVANLDRVWVMGDLFERDLRVVDVGQAATMTTAAYPDQRFEGRVTYVGDSIDPTTRTAKVRISAANPRSRLKAEMFVSVALQVATGRRALVVPTDAIFSEQDRSYVYVETGSGRFERRAIEIGHGQGPTRRVLSGLRAGDRVVVDGALLIRQEETQRAG